MPDLDLFGAEVVKPLHHVKGYADHPGTGPSGATCNQCQHYERQSGGGSKSWAKCRAVAAIWTSGERTDIKAKAPACSRFAPKHDDFAALRKHAALLAKRRERKEKQK